MGEARKKLNSVLFIVAAAVFNLAVPTGISIALYALGYYLFSMAPGLSSWIGGILLPGVAMVALVADFILFSKLYASLRKRIDFSKHFSPWLAGRGKGPRY
jgi:hypothetical protein